MVCGILLSSLAVAYILTYYISNERFFFLHLLISLLTRSANFLRNYELKTIFITFIF